MKLILPMIALTAVAALPLTAGALPASPVLLVQQDDVQEVARGNVTKIDAAGKSFNINSGAEGAKDVTITWNDTTVFMLDGKIVKWDELVKEKANLTVTHKKGVASKVEGVKM